MGLQICYRSVLIRCPKRGAEPVAKYMMDCDYSVWVASKNKKHKHCAKTQHCFGRSASLRHWPHLQPMQATPLKTASHRILSSVARLLYMRRHQNTTKAFLYCHLIFKRRQKEGRDINRSKISNAAHISRYKMKQIFPLHVPFEKRTSFT